MPSTLLKLKLEGFEPGLNFYLTELGGDFSFSSKPFIQEKWLYPASWVKLFWALQALLSESSPLVRSLLEPLLVCSSDLAGQELVDLLVGADSPQYDETRLRREELSRFWQQRGFHGIRLAHKTFLGEYSALDARLKADLAGENRVTFAQLHRLWGFLFSESELSEKHRALILKCLTRESRGG